MTGDYRIDPKSGSMTAGHGNTWEVHMLTERQADILIAGQDILINSVARTLDTEGCVDRREQAERVVATIAHWLTSYRPAEIGADYIGPLDLTAYILRKGQPLD